MRRAVMLLLAGALVAPASAGAAVTHQLGLQKVTYHHTRVVTVNGRIRGPVTATWYFDAAMTTGQPVRCVPSVDTVTKQLTPCPPCLHDEAQPIFTFTGVEVPVTRRFRRGWHSFHVQARLPGADAIFVTSDTFPLQHWGPPSDPERYSCNEDGGLL